MSADKMLSKEALYNCLALLGKEFRRLNGTKMPAELILVGGAAVLANYGFREQTKDMDAVITASSAMKDAANRVGERLELQHGWLNADFMQTDSYSPKLSEVSVHYRTFANILTVRTIAAEYLIAMKLMSGRQYKYDLSDVAGILMEHEKAGAPITRQAIDKAFAVLYDKPMPSSSLQFLEEAFEYGNFEAMYHKAIENAEIAKVKLLKFDKENPGVLTKHNIHSILDENKPSIKENLNAAKDKTANQPTKKHKPTQER